MDLLVSFFKGKNMLYLPAAGTGTYILYII